MEPPAAEWNDANRARSFQRFAAGLHEQAQAVFLKDGFHQELFLLVGDDGPFGVLPTPPGLDRDTLAAKLRELIRERNLYGIVHISEAWGYFRQRPRDHTFRQIMEGEIAVSELRPEDQDEALVVRMESRAGARFMWLTPILRDGASVTLGATLTFDDPPSGRFADLFEP